MGLEKQGLKPSGFIGLLVGRLMNKLQTSLYIEYFKNKMPPENSVILDLGCGGGKFIRFLLEANKNYKIFGVDHSPEMVRLSERVNRKFIKQRLVSIFQGSVLEIPLETNSVDLVTAFETIQFWPDIDLTLTEIQRVLKNDGAFLIINRYPEKGSRWWKMAKIKDDQDYINRLEKAGFKEVAIDLDFRKGWIVVQAVR